MMWKRKTEAEDMRLVEKNGVPYFVFENLENTGLVRHGFSTRLGGVSEGCLSSMNLSFTRGDDPEKVRENCRKMGMAIGFETKDLGLSDQTHPVHKAVGLSHSGWKGTVHRIGKVTLERMKEAFGTRPEDVQAAIGPSICQDCYEVSEDVAQAFMDEFADQLDDRLVYRKGNGKYQLNLWNANERILLEAGVRPEHLSITNICTCCNHELLFSHRASHGQRGNLAAFLGLK